IESTVANEHRGGASQNVLVPLDGGKRSWPKANDTEAWRLIRLAAVGWGETAPENPKPVVLSLSKHAGTALRQAQGERSSEPAPLRPPCGIPGRVGPRSRPAPRSARASSLRCAPGRA